MTLFNIWHYLFLLIVIGLFGFGIKFLLKQEDSKMRIQLIFSSVLIFILVLVLGIYSIDSYTKEAKVYRLENTRILEREEIAFSGVVKNEGNYEIGEVTLEIKMVNGSSGIVGSVSFYKSSGFLDFFSNGLGINRLDKPQQITKEFVIAKDLLSKESREFKVYLEYPPYFQKVSYFSTVYSH